MCLLNNGPFTAAAVAYNEGEWKELTREDDPRPRKWFIILLEAAELAMSPAEFKLLKEKVAA